MIRAFDTYMGKTMFHPIIIAICQMLKWTQYQFARNLDVVPSMIVIYRSDSRIVTALFGVLMVFWIVRAVRTPPEEPELESLPLRTLWWIMLFYYVGAVVYDGDVGSAFVVALILSLLFAGYARTIKTIPPRDEKFTKFAKDAS